MELFLANRIENYAKWHFVFPLADYLGSNMSAIRKRMRKLTRQKVHDDRGMECVQMAESVLPLALARPFVEKLLPTGNTVRLLSQEQCSP